MDLVVGLGGVERNACVALCASDGVLGICEQERITRVRSAGINGSGLPDQALDELLRQAGRGRQDIASIVSSNVTGEPVRSSIRLDHHFAHACAAFLPSAFESAAIVICDDEDPQLSVWDGNRESITRVDWPWRDLGFAEFYSRAAEALGFHHSGKEQRMEALARLHSSAEAALAAHLVALEGDHLRVAPNWQAEVEAWGADGAAISKKAIAAAAIQTRLADLVIEFIAEVRRKLSFRHQLCVGGSLFSNSYINSRIRRSRVFENVFVPFNPGNAGLAVGAGLHASRQRRQHVSPFLGPSYSREEIKATLDNCKLTYKWVSESDSIGMAVDALEKGRLVGWFEGRMEWGPRALGGRSIIANPFNRYVLDNLNQFLKQREPWRGYALSGTAAAVREHFDGPDDSQFMECDFVPRERERFRHVLPSANAAVRVHTVDAQTPPRFHALVQAFGERSGHPFVVNTSFNGFQEPIVCSPRDAIRVFFGTGIDLLVLDQFVLAK